jgi:hypothetical protein
MDKIKEYKDKNEEEEDEKDFIIGSKQNIDKFMYNFEYKNAFWLLILVLEVLDNNQKIEFIDYYSKNLIKYGVDHNFK